MVRIKVTCWDDNADEHVLIGIYEFDSTLEMYDAIDKRFEDSRLSEYQYTYVVSTVPMRRVPELGFEYQVVYFNGEEDL